jgi:hypothetical protein
MWMRFHAPAGRPCGAFPAVFDRVRQVRSPGSCPRVKPPLFPKAAAPGAPFRPGAGRDGTSPHTSPRQRNTGSRTDRSTNRGKRGRRSLRPPPAPRQPRNRLPWPFSPRRIASETKGIKPIQCEFYSEYRSLILSSPMESRSSHHIAVFLAPLPGKGLNRSLSAGGRP